MILHYLGVFLIGVIVGFLGGLFGKGGSAIATPMLSLIGVPGFIAVAAPLPATVPGTLIASVEYWKSHLLDWEVVKWSIAFGVPATILGSYLTQFTGSAPLLIVTGIMVLGFGISFLVFPKERENKTVIMEIVSTDRPSYWHLRLLLIAIFIGLISGLLANSGGFLLAPSYARILHQPIKKAFACSLAVSVILALPGTIVHAYLGHIDWMITLVLSLGSVPFSLLGAKVAIRSSASILERIYGLALTFLGIFFLFKL
ncbi:MAG TPA: sulfite exporter TauE/SafE family protein [Ignavibacteriales bacterium]|nr:sulfite exporter TauE/SafE family protein [Ignavibacteriales bacterium]